MEKALPQRLVAVLAAAAVLGSMWAFTPAAGQCAEGDPTVTPCPSALAAAQALTGNNAQLPISNAVFSGVCTVGAIEAMVLLTTMGCHELANLMPLGALVLSTGDARIGATTSNTAAQKTLQQGGSSAINADLQAQSVAAGYQQQLHDQVLLQFDVTPTASGALAFQYVFGSEEYPDFAASPAYPTPSAYNDIFAFFVWPAASGGVHTNVALLPNTSTPVSINSVNALASTFYIPNDFGSSGTVAKKTELNGLTTLLKTVDYQVTAGTAYRVLLAIADGFDDGIDSVVWVKAGSVRFNIKDCVGSWTPRNGTASCSGRCEGGAGLLSEVYIVTQQAQNGGLNCSVGNGTTRSNATACVNSSPCPVNCTGSWVNGANCTGACSGGSGFLPEVFLVSSPALYGGSCPFSNGTSRSTTACVNNVPCPPRNCVGAWQGSGQCTGACGGGAGLLPELFLVTTTAAYNGTDCAFSNATSRQTTPCNNTAPCPVACVGQWTVPDAAACSGPCGNNSGFVPEMFAVGQPSLYGGAACDFTNGTLRFQVPCLTAACPPVDCVGSWVATGPCNASCQMNGSLPEAFNITVTAAYGGQACSFGQGAQRLVTACFNGCRDCVGSWANISCSGACQGGAGKMTQQFAVTTAASGGGVPCNYTAGATRSDLDCVNNAACAVPCNGSWLPNGLCNGACSGGVGKLPEIFVVFTVAQNGGTCPATNGTTRLTTSCTNTTPCPPVNCVGSWVNGTCNGTCGGGAGLRKQTFSITTAAAYNGTACLFAAGAVQWIDCTNTACCPVNCVGSWVPNGLCNGSCSGGTGKLPERYHISVARACSGTNCPSANNTVRSTTACVNNVPCPPRNCVGAWQGSGQCTGACGGGAGLLPELFLVTTTAAYNGTDCAFSNATSRQTTPCNNTAPCPVACVGQWTVPDAAACSGPCGNNSGFVPEMFAVGQPSLYGGAACDFTNGTLRFQVPCLTAACPPVDCVGSWVPDGLCTGGCGGLRLGGILPERYAITTQASHGGSDCPFTDGSTRESTQCTNKVACVPVACNGTYLPDGPCQAPCQAAGTLPERYMVYANAVDGGNPCPAANQTTRNTTTCMSLLPCPVDCLGSWVLAAGCDAGCGNGAGNLTEQYVVSTPATHNGSACLVADGSTRQLSCVNPAPCPVACQGSWSASGACQNASCGGGQGLLPETYTISVAEAWGGQTCPSANGTQRLSTACTNMTRCEVPCAGSWVAVGCSAACDAAGLTQWQFVVTTHAAHGGADCEAADGDTRSSGTCAGPPCPVACQGSWQPAAACDAGCEAAGIQLQVFVVQVAAAHGGSPCAHQANDTQSVVCVSPVMCPVNCSGAWFEVPGSCSAGCNSSGVASELYVVTVPAAHGGLDCPFASNVSRAVACVNAAQCPVDCQGSWLELNGSCSALCNSTGWVLEQFMVSTPAAHGGAGCGAADGDRRATATPCVNSAPCVDSSPPLPVDCAGEFVPDNASCTGQCGGGAGLIPELFVISQASLYGGLNCSHVNGSSRLTMDCVNTVPCPSVDCVGGWAPAGTCSGGCGGVILGGLLPERYVITTQASHGGSDCPSQHGDTRAETQCTNGLPCNPTPCNGTYLPDGPCQAPCQAAGTLPERYMVYANAVDGGNPCPAANQTTRNTTTCMSLLPCPVDCLGSWVLAAGCDAGCGNGAGNLTEQYVVSTPATHNGSACLVADGSTRQLSCVNPAPCPVACQGSWSASGACQNASCGGGQGLLPETYTISVAEAWGGQTCPSANGTQRLSTACTNMTRCEVPCAGSWVAVGCSAACDAAGLTQWQFVVTTHAAHGGADCEAADGDTRSSGTCAGPPCPVACQGSWQPAAACDAGCEAAGIQLQVFVVQVAAAHGGSPCAHQANDTQSVVCVSPVMCPVNCSGAWFEVPGSCSAGCNSSGVASELYVVTVPAAHGGLDCPFASNVSRAVACVNAMPCPLPVDCEGGWEWQSCSAACGELGFDVNMFVVTQPAMFGGKPCPVRGGVRRLGAACTVECPSSPLPVDCSGRFVSAGACSALCGGDDRGVIPMIFITMTPASLGGADCATSNGSLKLEPCTNSAPCPWSDVQLLDGAPVLPKLPASLNESDIRIKGGNVTIAGIRIEGASGFSSSSTAASSSLTSNTATADSGGSGNATSSKPLKPRVCLFNGSLAFVTFGVVVEVLGEFELQRSMSWAWSAEWQAWLTQVGIKGLFVLTREEIQDGLTVGVQTLKPRVSGFLTLYSAVYPGPGFSGRYDWAGQLELSPDPFQEWADASSLLASNGSNSSPAASPTPGGQRRSLLQAAANETSTGQTAVQGRVAVKESRTLVDNSGAAGGVLALDDAGEVQLVCLSNCPDLGQPGAAPLGSTEQQPGGSGGSSTAPSAIDTASTGRSRLLMIIVAAIAAPSGLAVLILLVVGAVLRRRRQRGTQQQQPRRHAGAIAAREQQQQQ